MSEFELSQLNGAQQQIVTDQFQFWMATTFAVVIASYTAGNRLALWARLSIAVLYAIAASVFFIRYLQAADLLGQILVQLSDATIRQPGGLLPSWLRRIVMVGGTLLAIVLICAPTIADRVKKKPPD